MSLTEFFSSQWFWRVTKDKKILPNYPKEINKFWYSLPPDLDRIDAIYERLDNFIVIFRGNGRQCANKRTNKDSPSFFHYVAK